MCRKILLPIDFTESAMTDRAIAIAQALAEPFDSELRLVDARSLPPIAILDHVPENSTCRCAAASRRKSPRSPPRSSARRSAYQPSR